MVQRTFGLIFSFLVLSSTLSCTGPSLGEYVPENKDEADIISLLIRFEEAKNNLDIHNYLNCLHATGKYMYGGSLMVSKSRLKKMLPEFWAGLKSKDFRIYPMSREELNGNFFLSGEFFNPKIHMNRNTAKVTVVFISSELHPRSW